MYSKGASFVIVLVALALVGGAVAVSNNPQFTISNSQDGLAAVTVSARDTTTRTTLEKQNSDGQALADIERQLTSAQKSGGISKYSYRFIESKLKSLEKKKMDTRKARALLKKLEVGGAKKSSLSVSSATKNTAPPPRGLGTSPQLKGGGENAQKGYWKHWETEYKPVGVIPPCPEPLVIPSPVDVSKVTSILYPGQVRGEYKAHGGFRLDNQSTNEATVRIPLDAELIYGSAHYQSGEIQYLLGFRMPCGIEYRLDHLLTLSPKFQALVDKYLPPPKSEDSRTTEVKPPVPVKAGEVVATEVGFRNTRNIGFDFGVYDLRKKNKKAGDPAWLALHQKNLLEQYAICWLDYLSPSEQAVVKGLPGADWKMGKTSDYCVNAAITNNPARTEAVRSGGKETIINADTQTAASGTFDAVKREIEDAQKTGGRFSKEHYERVERDLASAEKSGVNASEVARLRTILRDLTPHLADEEFARKEVEKAAAANTPCTDPPPVLTADFTDFSKIAKITAPGSPSFEGPKGHSFIWTGDTRVPLYAPVAGIYDSGSYSRDTPMSNAEYLLFFRVKGSCGWQFKFDHVLEPLDAIKAELPSEPKIADSRGTPTINTIEFKAGDLIGYTSRSNLAGNWDFGLYNMNEKGVLKAHGCYGAHCHSVCWPDFYTTGKKEAYRKLLDGPRMVCSF